jgi:hypothetical protein
MSSKDHLVDIGNDRHVKSSSIESVKPLGSGSSVKVGPVVVESPKSPSEIAQQVNKAPVVGRKR